MKEEYTPREIEAILESRRKSVLRLEKVLGNPIGITNATGGEFSVETVTIWYDRGTGNLVGVGKTNPELENSRVTYNIVLSDRHGVTPTLYYRIPSDGIDWALDAALDQIRRYRREKFEVREE